MKQFPEIQLHDGRTLLQAVVQNGSLGILKRMLEIMPDEINTGAPEFPIHLAARAGHVEAVHQLLRLGGDINQPNATGNTSLHEAALGGHIEVLCELLDAGADVTARNKVRRDTSPQCD